MPRSSRLLLTAALLAAPGCASGPVSAPMETAVRTAPLPEAFSGIPAPVLAERAAFELEAGDPARIAAARCVLRALEPSALEAWMQRALASPEGSALRRAVISVLVDRGEPVRGFTTVEVTAACLDDILADVPGRRGTLLAAAHIRGMGESSVEPLRAEAAAGGPRGEIALRLLRMQGLPARALPGVRQ